MSFLAIYWRQIGVLVLMAALFGGGWYKGASHERTKQEAAISQARKEALEKYSAEVVKNNKISKDLEEARANREIVYRDVVKNVSKIIDRPVYRNVCVDDDGLRIIRDAIDGKTSDPGEPSKSVPGVGKAEIRDRG